MTAESVKERIVGRLATTGITSAEMAMKMRMGVRTWQRRIQKPETITLGELEKIQRILKVEL